MTFAAMMLLGMAIDLAIGWPDRLYARIGHPVTWLGALITALEDRLNDGPRATRLRNGMWTMVIVTLAAALPALIVQSTLNGLTGIVIGGILAWPLIAVRSMRDHVAAVARPLVAGDLAEARRAVSMIVGRDPQLLDRHGVARAALESLAENTSDGIVAPLFWGVLFGLPGIAAYKAINTLDSMIGHRNDRFEAYGKASAQLDDLVNLPPARLTGLLFALSRPSRTAHALRIMRRDAPAHRSPNAGWPEGAMAGVLNVRLSGPRRYGTTIADEPWLNDGAPDPEPQDLARGLSSYDRAMALLALALAALALL